MTTNYQFQGALYQSERERDEAAAYSWLTAGGANSLDEEFSDEQEPEWHAMVVAGLAAAQRRLQSEQRARQAGIAAGRADCEARIREASQEGAAWATPKGADTAYAEALGYQQIREAVGLSEAEWDLGGEGAFFGGFRAGYAEAYAGAEEEGGER